MRIGIDTDVGDNPDDAVALLLATAHPAVELVGVRADRPDVARALVGDDVLVSSGSLPFPDAHVVAIGPLTAVADLDTADVTIMGGALAPVLHRGEVREVESNFARDPAAARRVLAVPGRRVVPLDVTVRMTVPAEALAGVHRELERQLDAWPHDLCLHDPLALLVAVGDVAAEERVVPVTVEDDGRLVTGAGVKQRVVVDADVDAARRRVLELLVG